MSQTPVQKPTTPKCSDGRPPLPLPIKNQLRRESWFGCCSCGDPLVEFHHIRGWRETMHDPEHMLALCPSCHAKADGKAFDEIDQREMKAEPFNKRHELVSGRFYTSRDVIIVALGENYIVGSGYQVSVDDELLLGIEIGERNDLLITLSLYDSHDNLALHIVRNEWILGADLVSNVIVEQKRIRIQSPLLENSFEIDARQEFLKVRGSLRYKGTGIDIWSAYLRIAQAVSLRGIVFFDAGIAVRLRGGVTIANVADGARGAMTTVLGAPTFPGFALSLRAQYLHWRDNPDT